MIKRFGTNVNLGNIPPTDLLTLESFRMGLKEHTLLHTFERQRDAAAGAAVPATNKDIAVVARR